MPPTKDCCDDQSSFRSGHVSIYLEELGSEQCSIAGWSVSDRIVVSLDFVEVRT